MFSYIVNSLFYRSNEHWLMLVLINYMKNFFLFIKWVKCWSSDTWTMNALHWEAFILRKHIAFLVSNTESGTQNTRTKVNKKRCAMIGYRIRNTKHYDECMYNMYPSLDFVWVLKTCGLCSKSENLIHSFDVFQRWS